MSLDLPADLALAVRAHTVIVDFLKEHAITYTGGGRVFYSPKEWAARGEEYCRGALLIVTYDGGEHRRAFTLDAYDYALNERLQKALGKIGCFFEEGTHWYGGVYER